MDLDDIDKWSRELLQKEARKRGYINASMYSRPELIRLILRHDYAHTKGARHTALSLLDKAKSAFRSGLDAAAHVARGKAKSAAHPPGGGWADSPRGQVPAAHDAAHAAGETVSARNEAKPSASSETAGARGSATQAARSAEVGRAREYETFPSPESRAEAAQPSSRDGSQASPGHAPQTAAAPDRAREHKPNAEGSVPGTAAATPDRAREHNPNAEGSVPGTAAATPDRAREHKPDDEPTVPIGAAATPNRARGHQPDPEGAARTAAATGESQSPPLSIDLAAAAPARTSPRSMFPGAAPPATASSAQGAATSTQPLAAGTPSAHVDPTPELRPPALGGAQGEPPPPLELQTALTDAQLSAAATPIAEPRAPSVRVEPKPELFPPAKEGLASAELNASTAAPSSLDTSTAGQMEYGSSPWSLRPAAPKEAPPFTTPSFEHAPPSAAGAAKDGDRLTYGPHTEHGLLLRWQVTADGVERARAVLGSPGELAVRIVAVRTDDHAVVHTEVLDHGPVENRGDWTAPLPPNAARYVSAVGLRTPERFVSIVHAST